MAGDSQASSQAAIAALHARGWTDQAIGRAVGRNSSLIHQIGAGKKPGTNLAPALGALRDTGLAGPKSSKQLPNVALPAPTRRTRASGQPARVRESGKRASHAGGAQQLPNGQRRIEGSTKAAARFAASVADGLSGNARVKVAYKGTDGSWHVLAQKGGMTPEALKGYIAGGKSWREALAAMVAAFYPSKSAPEPTGEAEFYVVTLGAA